MRLAVFVDQSAEDLPSLDGCGQVHDAPWHVVRCLLLSSLMGTVLVVVPGHVSQNCS
jgi:hypothetical protein